MRKYLGFRATRPDVFQIISRTLLAATFVVVPVETGPAVAAGLNLTGYWAAIGYAVAVVFDLVWLAALSRVPAAVRQRSRAALVAALGVATVGAALSVTGVLIFGTMPALAAVPVVALAVHALGQVFAATLADSATDGRISDMQRADRNRKAESGQGARSMALTRTLAADARVSALLAEQDDADAVEAALTARLAAREVRRTEQAARLEKGLARTMDGHGAAAAAFRSRGLTDAASIGTQRPRLRLVKGDPDVFDSIGAARNAPDLGTVPSVPHGGNSGNAVETTHGNAVGNLVPSAPDHTDSELLAKGRAVWAEMGRPRTKAAFRDAMRAAGVTGRSTRLNAVYERIETDVIADATAALRQDVDTD